MSRDRPPEHARDAHHPPRKVWRDPPDLPVHHGRSDEPTACGLPAATWAARTNIAAYVTCPGCRSGTE